MHAQHRFKGKYSSCYMCFQCSTITYAVYSMVKLYEIILNCCFCVYHFRFVSLLSFAFSNFNLHAYHTPHAVLRTCLFIRMSLFVLFFLHITTTLNIKYKKKFVRSFNVSWKSIQMVCTMLLLLQSSTESVDDNSILLRFQCFSNE